MIPTRADLAQRRLDGPAVAHEEPTDERLGDAVAGAPGRERGRAREAQHPHPGPQGVVGGDVDGRRGTVGKPQALDTQVRRPAHRAADQDVAADLRQGGRRHGASVPAARARAGERPVSER